VFLLDNNVISELRRPKSHGAVVTRNESDFRVFDVKVLNPFSAG
jgi:predicted nucleic acid-binding protein